MAGLFDSYELKGMRLRNRVVMPPMCQYVATSEGDPTDWHYVHYGARAVGGAGLIILEATAVEPRGRLSGNDLGLWADGQIDGLSRLARVCQEHGATMGIQLGHGGRKAWAGPDPLVAPSAIPFAGDQPVPVELSVHEIQRVVSSFAEAARRAVSAGFEAVEIHGAHGYLIHQFLSPYSNRRTDEYGGPLENRLRFPTQVIRAVKAVLPPEVPLFIRVSAEEYVEGGYTLDEMVQMCQGFKQAGVDLIHVSTGGAGPQAPAVWPGYQVPHAERIRREVGLPVIAVGKLDSPHLAESVIRQGQADLAAVGRAMLRDPHWAIHAALALGERSPIPESYQRGYR